MSLSTGERVGPYEIAGLIGRGGMGEVYRARDTRLDRTVAIKVLPEHVASDPLLKQRFEREAKALAMLSHPHICPVFDVGRQHGVDFLVMEYLEGETLAERLAKGGVPRDQALRWAVEIADALDKAHRQGVVHRDLKPGNIMITKSGAKLLDFGLAKLRPVVHAADIGASGAPTAAAPLSGTGTIVGTLQYMAPEQLEGRDADRRTDIFAFGAMLYEMITGRKAFEGASHASLISAILKDDPQPMAALDPLAPPALDRVVRGCLAKDPDDRWQDARDLKVELQWSLEASSAADVRGTPRARGHERLAWALAMVAVAIAALAVPLTRYLSTSELLVTRLDVATPPTTDAFSFALSPNGRQLVFAATGDGAPRLWLRRLDQADAQPLAGTDGAASPFWAPDGRAIGFFADGKLKRADLAGGQPQVLADAPVARGGTWNADGVIIFAPSANSGGLMRVMATGGTSVPATKAAPGQGHRWPEFLPDGRQFIFSVYPGPRDALGVYVASVEGGDPVRLLATETAAAYAPPGYLLHVSQGVLVARSFDAARGTLAGETIPVAQPVGSDAAQFRGAFSVSATGVLTHRTGAPDRRQLVRVDRTGKVLDAIGAPDENALGFPELSADGQRLAVARAAQGNYDVWLMDAGRDVPTRLTFDAAVDVAPLWAPDGRRLVFISNRNGVYDLFEKPASGGADEQLLLATPHDKVPVAWSPDGRFVLYSTQDPSNQSDLWVVPLTGERKPFPVVQTSFDEVQGQFSPDGRWLAYASNQSGRYEIYVRGFPESGGQWQVSTGGGIYPRWRPDGRELFYVAPDGRLMAAPIRMASDQRALDPGAPVPLFSTRLASGANVAQAGFASRAQYAVAPDARFLLNVAADDAVPPPITVVLNWTAGLPR